MRTLILTAVSVALLSPVAWSQNYSSTKDDLPRYQDDSFQNKNKKVQTLWASIPFFPGGDIGQYEQTMRQGRDQVRKMFWNELMSEVQKLAEKGVVVEAMIEPMANILMMFDQVHDKHKAKDVINIDYSLEQQFKAAFDNLFKKYDVRDTHRKIQISHGTNSDLLQAYIRGISSRKPLGEKITAEELNVKYALEMLNQIDFISYGTFSSLGRGQFQLTFHIQGNKNGVTRNFISRGRLTEALDDLAKQVFDFFQKNVYEEWSAPNQSQLVWLPMPINAERERRMEESGVYEAYSFTEAKNYCTARGYRLPYAREILMAETGTEYKEGGISNLRPEAKYPVSDKRSANDNYWIIPGNSDRTGGPFMSDGSLPMKGLFWCVKGTPAADVQALEKVWSLLRKYSQTNLKVTMALETIRAELGDFDAGERMYLFRGKFVKIELMNSIEEALDVLEDNNINFIMPGQK
ncbi:MAG: hypothetical protein BroJett040_06690 [Oligoflexia bacterium]|nr:MAG: hypothetical protein BroJett040_06690 [Oligoflexia bacterium]